MLKTFSKKFILIYLIFASLLFYRLGTSMFTADSHFWYIRTQNFIKNVKDKDWAETYQNPKPGVTIMWVSGIAMDSYLNYYENKHGFKPYIFSSDIFPRLDLMVKAPLVALCLISVLTLYLIVKKILGERVVFLSILLLVFQPYYIGVSRFFHGDGTLTAFMTLSAIFLIYYAIENQKILYLVVSGIFGGMAILTKMQAIYLIPYSFLVLAIKSFIQKEKILNLIKIGLIWFTIFLITVFALFPALWVNPKKTFMGMYREATGVTDLGSSQSYETIYLKRIPQIIHPIPILLFLIGLSVYIIKIKKKPKKLNKEETFLLYTLIYVIFYIIQMQLVSQKSSRYLLPIFTFMTIFSAYGLIYLLDKIKNKNYQTLVVWILSLYLIINAISYAPHYTAMTENNPWGSLSYEAANYLNKKSKAHLLHVMFIPKEQTFRPFFKGTTYARGELPPEGNPINYIVVSKESEIPRNLEHCVFEYSVTFKGREFWRVYKCN